MKWIEWFIVEVLDGIKLFLLDQVKAIPILVIYFVFILLLTLGVGLLVVAIFNDPSHDEIALSIGLAIPVYMFLWLFFDWARDKLR